MKLARARVVNGRNEGVRLSGIRDGSPLSRLGLRNGDVLRAINGRELTTGEAALEAYASLRNAAELRISLARGGGLHTLEYLIR
jgi:general secretion pathway protein C